MKKRIIILLAIFLLPSLNYAQNVGFIKGTIKYIRYHNEDWIDTAWCDDFWILIDAIPNNACNCMKFNEPIYGGDGGYLFHIEGDNKNLVAFVLAAKNAGSEVSVYYDDSKKDKYGFCKVRYIGY